MSYGGFFFLAMRSLYGCLLVLTSALSTAFPSVAVTFQGLRFAAEARVLYRWFVIALILSMEYCDHIEKRITAELDLWDDFSGVLMRVKQNNHCSTWDMNFSSFFVE